MVTVTVYGSYREMRCSIDANGMDEVGASMLAVLCSLIMQTAIKNGGWAGEHLVKEWNQPSRSIPSSPYSQPILISAAAPLVHESFIRAKR